MIIGLIMPIRCMMVTHRGVGKRLIREPVDWLLVCPYHAQL